MKHDDVAARLEALGNPTRLEIVRTLVRTGMSGLPVGTLRERIGIAASTLSHHLGKLVTVGLVTQERRGTTLICRTEFETMKETASYLIEECCAEEPEEGAGGEPAIETCCDDGCCSSTESDAA